MARRNFSYEEVPTGQEASTPQPVPQHNNLLRQSYHDSPPATPAPQPPSHGQYPAVLPAPLETHVSPSHRYHPSQHPDSRFGQANQAHAPSSPERSHHHRRSSSSRSVPLLDQQQDPTPPPPPPHRRKPVGSAGSARNSVQDQGLPVSAPQRTSMNPCGFGADDLRALRALDEQSSRRKSMVDAERRLQRSPARDPSAQRRSYFGPETGAPGTAGGSPQLRQKSSYSSSNYPFVGGGATPGSITPNLLPSEGSSRSYRLSDYQSQQHHSGPYLAHDSPYGNNSYATQVSQADINPQDIIDDGDDGFMPMPKRKSLRDMAGYSGRSNNASRTSIVGAPAGAMGAMGALAGKQKDSTTSVVYDPVVQRDGPGGGMLAPGAEKSEWRAEESTRRKKMRRIFVVIGCVVLAMVIAGAILGGVFGSRATSNRESGRGGSGPGASVNNADDDLATNGDIGKNTPEIKALMNNQNLHKVFPAMDYTPWGTQYPMCEEFPPSQNNVTRDMAVLSQLTNVVRLYGTDCNKTEMVLHSIKQLGLTDMKVWVGVWIDTNTTTNKRQLQKMYNVLEETSDRSVFKGVIVGNEALYRAGVDKASSEQNLIKMLTDVKSNFTKLGYDLPVTTSDLGDNWTAELVKAVDVVMSNIHPFFAGVNAEEAAGWTYSFWTNKNDPLVKGTNTPQVISEIGWPSGGGNDCGSTTAVCPDDTSGSVAGVSEMNTLMDTWVCQALDNGTDFFWFEAFDEPWKVEYNSPGKEWEDKWGLMDPGRNLKKGLKIPDCGGRTV